jgi:hypothetical protein
MGFGVLRWALDGIDEWVGRVPGAVAGVTGVLGGVRARWRSRSGAQRGGQGGQSGEGGGELVSPWPVRGDSESQSALPAGDPGGDVQ